MTQKDHQVEDAAVLSFNPILSCHIGSRFQGLESAQPNQERLAVIAKASTGALQAAFINMMGADLFEGSMSDREFLAVGVNGEVVSDVKDVDKVQSILVMANHQRMYLANDITAAPMALEFFLPSIRPTGEFYHQPDTVDFRGHNLPIFEFTLQNGEKFEAHLGRAAMILQLYYGAMPPIVFGFQNLRKQGNAAPLAPSETLQ